MVRIIYMVLATGMFFFQDFYFSVGGIELSLKNPCIVGILILAFLNFTVTVRLDRMILLIRHTAVQMFPCLIPLMFSLIIWLDLGADTAMVLNGVTMVIPQLLAILVAAATLYLFGSRGIWYCLGAMCAANLITLLLVIHAGGLGAFAEEFYTLLVTFTGETGPLMEQLETHELTFAFGPFLIYLFLYRKEISHPGLWMISVCFFLLVGLKRIAFPAIVLGILVALILRMFSEKAARQAAFCVAVVMMAASFLYIVGIRYGLFEYLEEHLGLDTMARRLLFSNVAPYYEISIAYMGRGTGFERFVEWLSGVEFQAPLRTQTQIHNDFLRMYLNIGFIGYWTWISSWLLMRLRYWFRQGGKSTGCLFLGICVYCFVLYATDNAIYYPYPMITCSLIPMACHMDTLAEDALRKCCGRWERQEQTRLTK